MAKTFTEAQVASLIEQHSQVLLGTFITKLLAFALTEKGFGRYEALTKEVTFAQLLSYPQMLEVCFKGNIEKALVLEEQAYIEFINHLDESVMEYTRLLCGKHGITLTRNIIDLHVDLEGSPILSAAQIAALIDVAMETAKPLYRAGLTIGFEPLPEVDGASITVRWETDLIKITADKDGETMTLFVTSKDNNLWSTADDHKLTTA